MGTFGLRLRQERENKGFRLVDIAKSTRVGIHHLAALEHEDFDALPNDVFVKGYIRVYAECLGIESDDLVDEYLRLARENRPERASNGEDPVLREMSRLLVPEKDRGSRLGPALVAGGAVIVLAVLAGFWMFGSRDDAPSAAATRADVAVDPMPARTTPAVETTPPPAEPAPAAERPAPQPEVVQHPKVEEPATRPPQFQSPPPQPQPQPQPEATPVVLSIPDFGVGTGVENRQLVGQADRFAAGTLVYFWTRVIGGRDGDTIRHVWLHEGRMIAGTDLRIGGSHWRTQSRKTLWEPGRWAAEARDAAGNVLARAEFECVGSD